MLFKSKLIWISAVLAICAMVFFVVTYYHAEQPSKPVIVSKYVESEPPKKQQLPESATKTKNTRYNTAEEMDTKDTNPTNLSENTFTDTHDESDDPITPGQADNLEIEAEADTEIEAGAAYIAQQVAELRPKITHALQERIDLFDLIYDLAGFGIEDEEPYALRQQLQNEAKELRRTAFNLCNEYIFYTMDDSPFKPDGEFYGLMEKNRISVSIKGMTLEEIKNLR